MVKPFKLVFLLAIFGLLILLAHNASCFYLRDYESFAENEDDDAGYAENSDNDAEEVSRILGQVSNLMLNKAKIVKEDDVSDFEEAETSLDNDIRLTPEQAKMVLTTLKNEIKGINVDDKGVPDFSKNWQLPIKFAIHKTDYNETEKALIRRGFKTWEEETCIRFQEFPSKSQIANTNSLFIFRGEGCYSNIGVKGSTWQKLSMGTRCLTSMTTTHELGHALGLSHEQSRSDRDKYVNINLPNIIKGKEHNFAKYPNDSNYDCHYDYLSLMHYGAYGFAKKTEIKTIEAKDRRYLDLIGQRKFMTFCDVKIINVRYNCINLMCRGKKLAKPCQNGGYQDPNDCAKCKCPLNFYGVFCQKTRSVVASPDFHSKRCRTTVSGRGYIGKVAETKSGLSCQSWTSQRPHKHQFAGDSIFPDGSAEEAGSYCRNPDGKFPAGVWCYTEDKSKRAEMCNVPECDKDAAEQGEFEGKTAEEMVADDDEYNDNRAGSTDNDESFLKDED